MRPRVCPTCTANLGREIRHRVGRLCSQVQAERRRDGTEARLEAQRKRRRARYHAQRHGLEGEGTEGVQ